MAYHQSLFYKMGTHLPKNEFRNYWNSCHNTGINWAWDYIAKKEINTRAVSNHGFLRLRLKCSSKTKRRLSKQTAPKRRKIPAPIRRKIKYRPERMHTKMSIGTLLQEINETTKWVFTDFLTLYTSPGGALLAVASALTIIAIIINALTHKRGP